MKKTLHTPRVKKQAQLLEKQGRFLDALKLYHKIIKQEPKNPYNYNAVAVIFYNMGRFKDAATSLEDAIKLKHDYGEAYSNLGAIHAKFKNYNKAIQLYKKAISLKPNYAGSYTNLGNALNKTDEHEEAVHFHKLAISLDANSANNYANCASAYKNLGRFDRAEKLYKKAISLNQNHVNAHFDLATVLLQQNKSKEGLIEYEWRFRKDEMRGHLLKYQEIFKRPIYKGQKLNGESVLVHLEQGFGDALMVARYLFELKNRGAKIILYLRKALKRLFDTLDCIDEIIIRPDKAPKSDFQISIMSLPLALDAKLQKLTIHYPYFKSQKPHKFKTKKLKIGIVWGASNTGESYKNKVFDLRHFKMLSKHKDIQVYSLQVGDDSSNIQQYNMQNDIIDMSNKIDDFLDTTNIIAGLDVVITSDTSVAHLAGAMGANVWVILQKIPDWRWGVDENISKWYPSARLFRQHSLQDFNSVFRQIYTSIDKEFNIKVINA